MAFQMVDGDERLSRCKGNGLSGRQPDEKAADEPGSGGSGDAVEIGKRNAGLRHRRRDDTVQRLNVGAGRDLRHHSAEGRVVVDLGEDYIGEDPPAALGVPLDDRGRRFVATGFDAENDHDGRDDNGLSGQIGRWERSRGPFPNPLASGRSALQSTPVRIGTRGSPLALVQAEETRRVLAEKLGRDLSDFTIVPLRTTGDRITDNPLTDVGGKGLFTKEIDEALLDGRVDIGVHSAKDMPTRLAEGLAIAGCLPRADVRDAFISPVARSLADLPAGSVVGTSSLRRRALVLRHRPDVSVVNLRGNVETRLRKIEEGQAQATLLAAAGLLRLGLADRVAEFLDPDSWVPAPGQGAIAIAARADDWDMHAAIAAIDHRPTSIALTAERAFLDVLDGSCRTPIGGLARIDGDALSFRGLIVKPDGSAAHEVVRDGTPASAEATGRDAAAELLRRGGPDFFSG